MKIEQQLVQETRNGRAGGGEEVRRTHPAFGVAVVSRPRGGATRMFGSDLVHNSRVCIMIKAAEEVRSLSYDRHHGTEILMELEMSEAQWARFVASEGRGDGVPITLTYVRKGELERVPEIAEPAQPKHEVFGQELRDEVKRRFALASKALAELEALGATGGAIPKQRFRELTAAARNHIDRLPGTTEFIYDQFCESVEGVVEDAKIEAEAFVSSAINRAGLAAIREQGIAPFLIPDSNQNKGTHE